MESITRQAQAPAATGVPHLHTHVIPRRRGDGLRGFFWPRTAYAADDELEDFRARIAAAWPQT